MSDNSARGKEALNKLDRELKSRDRKEKTRPLGVVAASLAIILAVIGGIWFMTTRQSSPASHLANPTATPTANTATTTKEKPQAVALTGKRDKALEEKVTCEYQQGGKKSKEVNAPEGKDVSAKGTAHVTFVTNEGDVAMDLDRSLAPCTVNAITTLAKQGYYDGSICHRMTSGGLNVLQCGDPSGTGSGGPGFQFANEYPTDEVDHSAGKKPVTYPKGSVAMANAGPGTNGSQFFVNYADSTLTPDYTYFGNLTDKGLATMDKIAKIGVKGGASDGAPAEEIKIEKVTVEG